MLDIDSAGNSRCSASRRGGRSDWWSAHSACKLQSGIRLHRPNTNTKFRNTGYMALTNFRKYRMYSINQIQIHNSEIQDVLSKYIYISELYQEKKIFLVIPILFSLHAFGWSMVQQLRYLGDSQNSNGGIHHIVLGDRCMAIRKQRLIQLKYLIDEEKSCWASESN